MTTQSTDEFVESWIEAAERNAELFAKSAKEAKNPSDAMFFLYNEFCSRARAIRLRMTLEQPPSPSH